MLEHGTWLDPEDIDALLELPIPGVDELVGLIEIDRLGRRAPKSHASSPKPRVPGYDLVVVDTAPTGHTLRLLAAPDIVRAVAEVLDSMQEEHRLIREQLARVGRRDAADRLIEEIAAEASAIAARLRDRRETRFVWVTLPEPMSLAESQDAIAALTRARVPVPEVIVNRVLTDEGPCPICDRRRADEASVIARIRRTIGKGREIRLLPALDTEPIGLRVLRAMAGGRWLMAEGYKRNGPSHAISISPEPSAISHAVAKLPSIRGAKLLFVGGKGGVGKTTVAAAIAVSLARERATRRVLLLSTDPAHSLGDVFGATIGDRAAMVQKGPTNLTVREIDAAASLAARRGDLDAALDDIAASLGANSATNGSADLMDLAPPGIDELFGLLSVLAARDDYDAIVVDTAPTGHALRLLELPDSARAWVQVLMRVLLKYRTLVRPGRLAADLVDVSKSIRDFQALLRDPAATHVIVVTRAARLPRRETERLIRRLVALQLTVNAVVVNALTMTPGRCLRCRRTAAAERREMNAVRRAVGRRGIIRTPLTAPAPRGVRALVNWARAWLA